MITNFPVYNQQNYKGELGSGVFTSIAMYGCALSCVAMACSHYGKQTDPVKMNELLNGVQGFAPNGTGSFNLLKWGSVTSIFPDITLSRFVNYSVTPADMSLIDADLSKDYPVIVGVSFLHNAHATSPSHYVIIYRKNENGTYQMIDPWTGENSVFDAKYAVNGMSVPQCILQVIVYTGPVPTEIVAQAQQAQTDTIPVLKADFERMRGKCDRYDLIDTAGYHTLSDIDNKISELIQQKHDKDVENEKLKGNVVDAERRSALLASELSKKSTEDATAIDVGMTAQQTANDHQQTISTIASALKTKPTQVDILSNIDALLTKIAELKRASRPAVVNAVSDVKKSFIERLFS